MISEVAWVLTRRNRLKAPWKASAWHGDADLKTQMPSFRSYGHRRRLRLRIADRFGTIDRSFRGDRKATTARPSRPSSSTRPCGWIGPAQGPEASVRGFDRRPSLSWASRDNLAGVESSPQRGNPRSPSLGPFGPWTIARARNSLTTQRVFRGLIRVAPPLKPLMGSFGKISVLSPKTSSFSLDSKVEIVEKH